MKVKKRVMNNNYYTVSEAAQILNVSEQTVRDKLSTKEITGFKTGREWRIPKKEFNDTYSVNSGEDEKEKYIKDLEEENRILKLKIETFENLARAIVKVVI